MNSTAHVRTPRCPLRPGEPCTLCQIDVTGPADCGLVYLVMTDPDLRRQFHRGNPGAWRQPPRVPHATSAAA